MRGKILGFGNGQGVIIGEDDVRYPFDASAWRELDEPQRGQDVDFVAAASGATDIYIALGARKPEMPRALPIEGLREAPSLDEAMQIGENLKVRIVETAMAHQTAATMIMRIKDAPQIVVAAIGLLACLTMNFISFGYDHREFTQFGYPGDRIELSLFNLPSEASQSSATIDDILNRGAEQRDRIYAMAETMFGRSKQGMEQRRRMEASVESLESLSGLLSASYFLWLIPISAAAVVVLGWMRFALVRPVGLVFGLLSLTSLAYVFAWKSSTLSALEAAIPKGVLLNVARRAVENGIQLGSGAWTLALCGIICIYLGIIRPKSEKV